MNENDERNYPTEEEIERMYEYYEERFGEIE